MIDYWRAWGESIVPNSWFWWVEIGIRLKGEKKQNFVFPFHARAQHSRFGLGFLNSDLFLACSDQIPVVDRTAHDVERP